MREPVVSEQYVRHTVHGTCVTRTCVCNVVMVGGEQHVNAVAESRRTGGSAADRASRGSGGAHSHRSTAVRVFPFLSVNVNC